MNVLIAKSKEECKIWTDNIVVVDVLRSATTVCQLFQRGKTDVLVFEDQSKAVEFKNAHPNFEVYSELDFPDGYEHADNSTFMASKASASSPALLVTTAGTKAVFGARRACQIFMGGFCNFYALATLLKSMSRDVLLVPSALFGHPDDVEDFMCVSALKDFIQGFGNAETAAEDTKNTLRYIEFIKNGPKTAAADAEIAFRVNALPVVPTFKFVDGEDFAVCYPYGQQAPKHLTGESPEEEKPAEPEAVMPSLPDAEPEVPASSAPEEEPRSGKKITGLFRDFLKTVREEKKEILDTLRISKEKRREDVPLSVSKPSVTPSLDPVDAVLGGDITAASVTDAPARAAVSFGEERKKKAIVLFSGGLDSTTCLYWALDKGYECEALTVSYGQRHDREVISAEFIAKKLGVKLHRVTLNFPWLASSSLVDKAQTLPDLSLEQIESSKIPSTYVPGRNLMFLSIAASLLDSVGAQAIVAGPNAIDFSGYPDCTPAFFKAAADAVNRGTKTGVSEGVEVLAPLMRLSKTEIVQLGAKLKVPFELTWSCYAGGKSPCGHCDSCKLRAKGFAEAGIKDPAVEG